MKKANFFNEQFCVFFVTDFVQELTKFWAGKEHTYFFVTFL